MYDNYTSKSILTSKNTEFAEACNIHITETG
jgi:hypothetical protein